MNLRTLGKLSCIVCVCVMLGCDNTDGVNQATLKSALNVMYTEWARQGRPVNFNPADYHQSTFTQVFVFTNVVDVGRRQVECVFGAKDPYTNRWFAVTSRGELIRFDTVKNTVRVVPLL